MLSPGLRVLVVDDEPLARLRLRSLLAELSAPQAGGAAGPATAQVLEAADADAALAVLAGPGGQGIDLLLLDIGLPGRDGLKIAEALGRLPAPPALVFVTAHAEHALRAFELDAVDYLTKPVRRERLAAALRRVVQRRAAAPAAADAPTAAEPVLVVSDRGRLLRVPVAEVLYLKAELKFVTLVSGRGSWLLDDSLAELELRLGEGFIRVHRNAVVALRAVRALERAADDTAAPAGEAADAPRDNWVLRLANGQALAVSRRQLAAVREALAREGR